MNIRIITDSASDIIPPLRQGLTVIPMTIIFGQQEYLDGVNLSHKKFYELLVEGSELPTTSQLNPYQFEEAFQNAVDAGEDVIAIVLSSKLLRRRTFIYKTGYMHRRR